MTRLRTPRIASGEALCARAQMGPELPQGQPCAQQGLSASEPGCALPSLKPEKHVKGTVSW